MESIKKEERRKETFFHSVWRHKFDTIIFPHLFGPPATTVHGFVSQIFHVKSMHYLRVVLLYVKVHHGFVAVIFHIESSVSKVTKCRCASSKGNCCNPFN